MWLNERGEGPLRPSVKINRKLYHEQSDFQEIAVYETADFGNMLVLNGLFMCAEKTEFAYHEMLVHPAMCAHPEPRKVCVIGGGDGGAVSRILMHPSVEEVHLCEIDKRVVDISRIYLDFSEQPLSNDIVNISHMDGFLFVDQFSDYFDVIYTDSSDPEGPGEKLFESDYFSRLARAVKEDGFVVSQSESPWFRKDGMTAVSDSMNNYFNSVRRWYASVPLYPSGLWTFTSGSKKNDILSFHRERSKLISTRSLYYSPEIHRAAFHQPRFIFEKEVLF